VGLDGIVVDQLYWSTNIFVNSKFHFYAPTSAYCTVLKLHWMTLQNR